MKRKRKNTTFTENYILTKPCLRPDFLLKWEKNESTKYQKKMPVIAPTSPKNPDKKYPI